MKPRADPGVEADEADDSVDWEARLTAICSGLTAADPLEAAAATRSATRFLAAWPSSQVNQLDRSLRQAWAEFDRSGIYSRTACQKALIDALPADSAARNAGLIFLARHSSGFVRERAVGALSEVATPTACALVALCLDDWVRNVRLRAGEAWVRVLCAESAGAVALALPEIFRILQRQLIDQPAAWGPLSGLLETSAGGRALLEALDDSDQKVARAAWTAIETLAARPEGWLAAGLAHRNHWVRLKATLSLVAGSQDPAPQLQQLWRDRFLPIRKLSFAAAEERFPELLGTMVREGLLDSAADLRQLCQEELVMRLDREPAALYRSALAGEVGTKRRAAALVGLGETGGRQDRKIFLTHLAALSPRVRAAAVAAFGRLSDAADTEMFFSLLGDPSPRVARAAASVLQTLDWNPQDLAAAYRTAGTRAAGLAAIALSARFSVPVRLAFLMEVAGDREAVVASQAFQTLAPWMGQGWHFTRLGPTEKERLADLFEIHSGTLDPPLERWLRKSLRGILGPVVASSPDARS